MENRHVVVSETGDIKKPNESKLTVLDAFKNTISYSLVFVTMKIQEKSNKKILLGYFTVLLDNTS